MTARVKSWGVAVGLFIIIIIHSLLYFTAGFRPLSHCAICLGSAPIGSRFGYKINQFSSAPGANAMSACELTCSLCLSLARHVVPAASALRGGRWDRALYTGTELYGKTLAILGLGRVGREVAIRMHAFGMKVKKSRPFHRARWFPMVQGFMPGKHSAKWSCVIRLSACIADITSYQQPRIVRHGKK